MPPTKEAAEELDEKIEPTADAEADFDEAFASFASGEEADPEEATEPPAAEAEEEPAESEAKASPDKSTDEPPEPDPISKLQAERDEWRHRYQSDAGRVGALQKKLNALEAQLQERSSAASNKDELTDEQRAELAQFKEDSPELVHQMEIMLAEERKRMREELTAELTPVRDQLQTFHKRSQESDEDFQERLVEEQHAGWKNIVRSPEFVAWAVQQPPGVRSLAESSVAEDAIYLIDQFKQVNSQGKVDKTPAAVTGDSKADRLKAQRERQLANAEAVPSSRVSKKDAVDEDFESAFKHFAKRS